MQTSYNQAIVVRPNAKMAKAAALSSCDRFNFNASTYQILDLCQTLGGFGLRIIPLTLDNQAQPEDCFAGTKAVVTDKVAIMDQSASYIAKELVKTKQLYFLEAPAKLCGSDVVAVGNHYFISTSANTNTEGAAQCAYHLKATADVEVSMFELPEGLKNLRSGLTYLGGNKILISAKLADNPVFDGFEHIIPKSHNLVENCLIVGNVAITTRSQKEISLRLKDLGFTVKEIKFDEFENAGLSFSDLVLPYYQSTNKGLDIKENVKTGNFAVA